MSAWETSENVSREDAIKKIQEMAKQDGISGSFKVFYNDRLVANPEDLPETVDMERIRVSATLDNA